MSQFVGYKLELVLKDQNETKVKGFISKIVEKKLIVSHAEYLDGSNKVEKELIINGDQIKDLKVISLPQKKKDKKSSKAKDKQGSPLQDSKEMNEKNGNKQGKKSKEQQVKPQTPKLENSATIDSPYDYESKKIDWNTSNAKSVKKLEEFDFASNLQKFDKQSVFKELSMNDKTKPQERLVGHNKLPQKTNYDINEMVLEKRNDDWDKIFVHGSSDSMESKFEDAQETRSISRTSLVSSGQLGRRGTGTPIPSISLISADTKKQVPTCSPLQLSDIETLAFEKFGITSDIIVENSGREVAGLVVEDIIGKFRILNTNHNSPPLVLLLAGNNKSGAIALTAGRQLFNHGIRAIALILHNEKSEDELLPIVSKQLKIFKAVGGKEVKTIEQLDSLLTKLDSPLEFILDGLQGFDTNLSDLLEPEFNEASKVVNWSNSSELPIMSLHVPSGLDASSGSCEFSNYMLSKYIVSVGLPLNSILNTYKFGFFEKHEMTHYLVDCGLPRKVFGAKSALRKFEQQLFFDKWSVKLEVS